MAASPAMSWQPTLLDAASTPRVDEAFSALSRIQLDESSWVDYAPAWVGGSDDLFAELLASWKWEQRSRRMYDRRVEEPRLTAWWRASTGRPLQPSVLERMRSLLSARYGVELDSVGLNLYRDGNDSVAWHGDRIAKEIAEPVVAIVSVGHSRKFLLRHPATGAARRFLLGRGDLLVTGGACQRRWQHSVPKAALAGPRISITFRHGLGPEGEDPPQPHPSAVTTAIG